MNIIYEDSFGVTTRYQTYREAADDGAVQRGWIPAFVPQDAYDVVEWHIVSPSESFLKFKYMSRINLEKLKAQDAEKISEDDLKSIPSGVDKAAAKYYRLKEYYYGTACLIDDRTHKTAYFVSYCLQDRSKP